MSRILMALAEPWVGFWQVLEVITRDEFVQRMCKFDRQYGGDGGEDFHRTSKQGYSLPTPSTGHFYWKQMLWKWMIIYLHPSNSNASTA